jgi:hypothetical protein
MGRPLSLRLCDARRAVRGPLGDWMGMDGIMVRLRQVFRVETHIITDK